MPAIITENDISKWSDQTGSVYHFPKRYVTILAPGTKVIYYKGKLRHKEFLSKRLSPDPHYFGTAEISDVFADSQSKKSDYFAVISNYKRFLNAIPIKVNNEYLETIPESRINNYWRDGAREITQDTFDLIVSQAEINNDNGTSREDTLNDREFSFESMDEGKKDRFYGTRYERKPALRKAAIAIHGYSCKICSFNFKEFYGEYAEGLIHVHHLVPVSELGDSPVNPETDLIPVCPNCHSVIHRRKDKTLSTEEIKALIQAASRNKAND